MGGEGGGRFERWPGFYRNPELPPRGERLSAPESPSSQEGSPDATTGLEAEQGSWLSVYATPEMIDCVKASPYGERRSRESLLLERLTGVLVESGHEMDPLKKKQLRRFIAAFRFAALPNMTPNEQHLIAKIAEAHPDWLANPIDLEEVKGDIQATWNKFGFENPAMKTRSSKLKVNYALLVFEDEHK